jgi:glycosyltransferase involved in cell wall biosynthesis
LIVSILVPAFSEDSRLERVVRKLIALSLPEYEIFVVDNGSKDHMVVVTKSLMGQFPQIKLFCQSLATDRECL